MSPEAALAVNISRRHMTKGQQAIVVARAVFESNTELSRVEVDSP